MFIPVIEARTACVLIMQHRTTVRFAVGQRRAAWGDGRGAVAATGCAQLKVRSPLKRSLISRPSWIRSPPCLKRRGRRFTMPYVRSEFESAVDIAVGLEPHEQLRRP
jgi:hypothetical protein